MEIEGEEGSALITGVVRPSIGPLAGDGLDEPFGLAIGLWPVRASETMLEAQLEASLSKELGAISRTAVGEEALDDDAVGLIESDGLMERGDDAGSFFIWQEDGKSEAGMVIDGDVERLDARARIAVGPVAGGANAWLVKAAKLFNIKMKQLTGGGTLIPQDRRLGRIQGGEPVEAMPLEDAGKGSF